MSTQPNSQNRSLWLLFAGAILAASIWYLKTHTAAGIFLLGFVPVAYAIFLVYRGNILHAVYWAILGTLILVVGHIVHAQNTPVNATKLGSNYSSHARAPVQPIEPSVSLAPSDSPEPSTPTGPSVEQQFPLGSLLPHHDSSFDTTLEYPEKVGSDASVEDIVNAVESRRARYYLTGDDGWIKAYYYKACKQFYADWNAIHVPHSNEPFPPEFRDADGNQLADGKYTILVSGRTDATHLIVKLKVEGSDAAAVFHHYLFDGSTWRVEGLTPASA